MVKRHVAVPIILIASFSFVWPDAGAAAPARPGQRVPSAWPIPGRDEPAVAFEAGPAAPAAASQPANPAKNPKLSANLARLAAAARSVRLAGRTADLSGLPRDLRAMADAGRIRMDGEGMVQVYINPSQELTAVEALVRGAGGRVERSDRSANLVQAWIPLSAVEEAAANPAARYVRLPDYGIHQTGSVNTEGDAILRANLVRSTFGVTGTGVRVGFISDGVGGLETSQGTLDLPSFVDVTTCNQAGGDPRSSGAEGTAMMEIVHDLAPGAELWFGHQATSLDFNAAVQCLASHTDLVVDDISFFNVGPYNGTSVVSAHTSAQLADTSNRIRAYATSVGNYAANHYHEPFVDSGFTTSVAGTTWSLHSFAGSGATTDAGRHFLCSHSSSLSCGNPLLLKSGGTVSVFLSWNDPFSGSSNDYDLGLWDETTGTFRTLSRNPQTGTQPPVEDLSFTNPHADGFFDIMIGKVSGAPRVFDLFVHCDGCVLSPLTTTLGFNTAAGSVPAESDAGGGVLSAGAIAAGDAGHSDIEFFSSRGPTADGRTKPNITGIDCVSVTGDGGFSPPGVPFCGTSAAAPHIAGISALLLQLRPDLKAGGTADPAVARSVVSQALLSSAVHLGAPGTNNTFGAGRADAFAAAQAIQAAAGPCLPGATTLCIDHQAGDRRFEIRVHFSSPARHLDGDATATSLSSLGITEGGAFSFFSATNPEMLIKVIDGCALGGHYWVFFAAVSDVGFTVTVRDTVAGTVKTYSNADGKAALPVQDTSALACP